MKHLQFPALAPFFYVCRSRILSLWAFQNLCTVNSIVWKKNVRQLIQSRLRNEIWAHAIKDWNKETNVYHGYRSVYKVKCLQVGDKFNFSFYKIVYENQHDFWFICLN